MIKQLLIILVAWAATMQLQAANTVSVASASGEVGSIVKLRIDLDTDAADVVAAEIRLPLPEGVEPVEGGCVRNAARLPEHQVLARRNGSDCVIVIFNTSLKPIPAGSDEALTLTLDLGENPGIFQLTPEVKLSDAAGSQLSASAVGGTLEVLGARLQLGTADVNFGRVPIRGSYTRCVTATNTGTTTLRINEITTDVPGLSVSATEQEVEAGASTDLLLTYAPVERAALVKGRFTVYSNSVGRAPFVNVTSVPFSVNELHVGSAEGISDSEVTISLTMNNMEPIVGAEVSFLLPESLIYVENSVQVAPRADGLTARATFDGVTRRLRLLLFGFGNQAVSGNDGELMEFRLRLDGQSGYYSLYPERVILSNDGEENMVSATSAGYVQISSPYFVGSHSLNVGNVPLNGSHTFDYEMQNYGSAPLTIERVTFLDDIARCDAQLPIIINPNESAALPVTIANPLFGDFRSTMNIYTNDPQNRLVTVDVSGKFYSANELNFSGEIVDGIFRLCGSLSNEADIVALQLDVVTPDGITTSADAIKLLERAAGHSGSVAYIEQNRYRLVIFSLSNTSFNSNSGPVFTFDFSGADIEGKQLLIENIKLSNHQGENYTKPDSETQFVDIPVIAREILLSDYQLTMESTDICTVTATVLPENASDKTVVWSSGDSSIATVDDDGLVTAIAIGETSITATCGGATAVCEVTVVPTLATSIELNITELKMCSGDEYTLVASVLPENASEKTVEWASSDVSVAVVDENGKVSALQSGFCVISASTSDGTGLIAECAITVNTKTGIQEISADEAAKLVLYTVSGVRLQAVRLSPGIYIAVIDGNARLVLVR